MAGFTGAVTIVGNDDAVYEITENGIEVYVVPNTSVAQIGDVKYESLQAAIDAAANGATITVIADIEPG